MAQLSCDNCGVLMDVEITGPNGETLSSEEYLAANQLVGTVVLCPSCEQTDLTGKYVPFDAETP